MAHLGINYKHNVPLFFRSFPPPPASSSAVPYPHLGAPAFALTWTLLQGYQLVWVGRVVASGHFRFTGRCLTPVYLHTVCDIKKYVKQD